LICSIKIDLGVRNHDQPAAESDANKDIMNTNCQLENEYDYPKILLFHQREFESVENEVYNYATITN
jgi:hypothetical protein